MNLIKIFRVCFYCIIIYKDYKKIFIPENFRVTVLINFCFIKNTKSVVEIKCFSEKLIAGLLGNIFKYRDKK